MRILLMVLVWLFSVGTLSAQEISGVYKTEWGDMTLTQQGAMVTGNYPHNNGRIEGMLNGYVLTGQWYQSNGSGRIRFDFTPDFSAFSGKWGQDNAEPTENWSGQRIGAWTAAPVNVSGVYSSEWGDMTLTQQGANVTGNYPHNNGRIEGTLNGRVLTGQWYQSNGSGRIRFEFNSDLSSFSGKWGRDNADPTESWNGTKIK